MLRGPQSSGLLLGRKDLIAAARLNNNPNSDSLCRTNKVNKEELVGMLLAWSYSSAAITTPCGRNGKPAAAVLRKHLRNSRMSAPK